MLTRNVPARFVSAAVLCASALALCACGGAQSRTARHLAKGQTYLAAGNLEKARIEFQNALQISPIDPETRFEMGVVDEKLDKIREAAQFYQGTIDVSPDHVGARTHLARLYIYSGVADRALELLAPALQKHPDDSELLALRAAARVQQKDFSGALTDAQRAVQLNPTNPDAIGTLAGIYTSSKETAKAQALLESAVTKIPDTVDLRLALAQVYAGEDRTADVERILLDLVHLQPNVKAHRQRLAQFYARQNQLDAAEQALRDGIKALPQDRELKISLVAFLAARRTPEVAEKELKAMVAADPKDFEMKFSLAKFYQDTKHDALAESIYEQVIQSEKLDPPGLSARDQLAQMRLRRNDVAGAQKLLAEVLAKSPRDDDALIMRGDIALAAGDPKSAIADLRTVLRDQPNSIGVLRTLARAHLANGEPAIAEETMRRAVEANPQDAAVRLDLAQLLVQMGKPDQAKPILAQLVKERPDNVPAWDSLFRVSSATKDFATARSAADAIVATQPKAALGYMYEGMLAEEAKHSDDALRLYEQAAERQPDALEPLQAKIRLLVAAKRVNEALKDLDEAIVRAPKSAFPLFIKGELLLEQHNTADAQAAYQAAIALAPKWWLPYRGLAYAQFAAKEPDAALATLRNGQGSVEQPEQLGLVIAAYYESSGKTDEAMRQYEELVRGNPKSEVAANNLAMLLVTYKKDAGSLNRAKALSARFADSSNPSFLDTYGWVLFKSGEAAASLPVLKRVLSLAPEAPVALYHLGMAESEAGTPSRAVDSLTRAVNSGAKFSGLEEAKATLDRLGKQPSVAAAKT